MRKLLLAASAAVSLFASPAIAQTGNGGPSGPHFNLNLIGVAAHQDRPDNASGHVIFVPLNGNTKIMLSEGDFAVLDKDGTDGTARFQLPNPDPDGDGTTEYSVFARALGKPGGKSTTTTCASDSGGDIECSLISMVLVRDARKPTFTNVSKYLLYIYADIDEDGTAERVPLFSDALSDYYWDHNVEGLRLAQLRFYPCSTTVPDATNPGGPQDDSSCF